MSQKKSLFKKIFSYSKYIIYISPYLILIIFGARIRIWIISISSTRFHICRFQTISCIAIVTDTRVSISRRPNFVAPCYNLNYVISIFESEPWVLEICAVKACSYLSVLKLFLWLFWFGNYSHLVKSKSRKWTKIESVFEHDSKKNFMLHETFFFRNFMNFSL